MNSDEIVALLRGWEGSINLARGIEEDDALAHAFMTLPAGEHAAFWPVFADALRALINDGDDLPVYLSARFLNRMAEIEPPTTPENLQTLFGFLLDLDGANMPAAWNTGVLLILLLLNLGDQAYWRQQCTQSLDVLDATDEHYLAVAAVVYAYLGYGRHTTVPANDWARLLLGLNKRPKLPRMELLELLVGVERQERQKNTDSESLRQELEMGMDQWRTSTSDERYTVVHESLASVLRAWRECNAPAAEIETWLDAELRPHKLQTMTPRERVYQAMQGQAGMANVA